jgi:hypothetical protein
MKIPSWVKPAFWGAVVGAAGWWAVLSWQFGWVSLGTADLMAQEQAQKAVVAYAAPACVARFERQPNAVAEWKTLKSTDTWSLTDAVRKAGWVGLPGQKLDSDLADAIANSCAPKILALTEINGVKLTAN